MTIREPMEKELDALPEAMQREVFDFVRFLRSKSDGDALNGLLASDAVLARDWDTDAEDAAWQIL